jgi:hypothetical protein
MCGRRKKAAVNVRPLLAGKNVQILDEAKVWKDLYDSGRCCLG